jgi:nucleoside-diphosphate-sugar epimerase
MQVIITGAGGFIGRRLVRQLLTRGILADAQGTQHPIKKLLAVDLTMPPNLPNDSRLEFHEADISNSEVINRIITAQTSAIFHLAAIVSVGAEEDFDLGMKINLDTTRALLERCRHVGKKPSLVFASSVAVYGGEMPAVLEDQTAPTPQTSYGTQKAICELLINDYNRKGFVDGRSLRLPTIVVRPGKPNKAASTFASSIIREPLEGREVACPVPAETSMFLLSPRKVVDAFIEAQAMASSKWGVTRALQLPGLTLSVRAMLEALEVVAGPKVAARVRFEPDPRIEKIVYGWPTAFKATRALQLGFTADRSMQDIIKAFIEDDLNGKFVN